MDRSHPWVRILAVLATLMLVLAACGGDDDTGAPDTTNGAEDNGDAADDGGEPATLDISAVDNSYDPSSLTAPAGAEVTVNLTNDGSNPHTFTATNVDADTGTVDPGSSGSATFTMPDEQVTFQCAIHGSSMSGTIEPE